MSDNKALERAYDVINKYVDSITLEDLVNESVAINSPDFCI